MLLTEAVGKITEEGKIVLQGSIFDVELMVSASSSRPFRLENCYPRSLQWRPRTKEEWEKLWSPSIEVDKLGVVGRRRSTNSG